MGNSEFESDSQMSFSDPENLKMDLDSNFYRNSYGMKKTKQTVVWSLYMLVTQCLPV